MNEIDISIIMIDGSFREKFHSLEFFANQDFPRERYELIWVEYFQDTNAKLKEALEVHPGFRVVCLGKSGTYHSSFCFNQGIREARGRLIVIPDADIVVEPHFLSELWRRFEENPEIATYIHRFDEPEDIHREPVTLEHLRRFCVLTNPQNYGGCLSLSKARLLEINGYEEHPLFGSGFHANGLDVYTRLRNFGVPVSWHPTLRLYHPWHPQTGHGHPFWKAQGLITQHHATAKTFLPYQGIDPSLNSLPAAWLMDKIELKLKELAAPGLDLSPQHKKASPSLGNAASPADHKQLIVLLLAGTAILFVAMSLQFFVPGQVTFPLFTVMTMGLVAMTLLCLIYRNFKKIEERTQQVFEALVGQSQDLGRLQGRIEALGELQSKSRENFRVLNIELGNLKNQLTQQLSAVDKRQSAALAGETKRVLDKLTAQLQRVEKSIREESDKSNQAQNLKFVELTNSQSLQWTKMEMSNEKRFMRNEQTLTQWKDTQLKENARLNEAIQSRYLALQSELTDSKADLLHLKAEMAQGLAVLTSTVVGEVIQQGKSLTHALESEKPAVIDLSALIDKQSQTLDLFRKHFWEQLKVQMQALQSRRVVGAPKPPAETAPAHYRPSPSDILLVSYPGAGMQELRKVIAECLYGYSGETPNDLDFFIPDLQVVANWSRIVSSEFHFVKNHGPYFATDRVLNGFTKLIYLKREPTATLASQFRFLQAAGRYTESEDQFLKDSLAGLIWPGTIASHFDSWLGQQTSSLQSKMLVVDFDELDRNPESALKKIFKFCHLSVDAEKIAMALTRCSMDGAKAGWFSRSRGFESDLVEKWKESVTQSLSTHLTPHDEPSILLNSTQGESHVRDTH